jgi:hypothetical protein
MAVKSSPAKRFPAPNDLNQTSSVADIIDVSNNATMSPKKWPSVLYSGYFWKLIGWRTMIYHFGKSIQTDSTRCLIASARSSGRYLTIPLGIASFGITIQKLVLNLGYLYYYELIIYLDI